MRAVGVEHLAAHQAVGYGLLDDMVEDVLSDIRPVKPAAAVLAEGRGIKHLIRQPQPDEPAIGNIHLDLAHQLPLGPDAKQVADEQRLKEHLRRNRRTPVVGAIQAFGHLPDEPEVNRSINLAQQMIARNCKPACKIGSDADLVQFWHG